MTITYPKTIAEFHERLMADIWNDDNLDLYAGTIQTEDHTYSLENAIHVALLLGAKGGEELDLDGTLTQEYIFPDGSLSLIDPHRVTASTNKA